MTQLPVNTDTLGLTSPFDPELVYAGLTNRQKEVLRVLTAPKTLKEVAKESNLSLVVVRNEIYLLKAAKQVQEVGLRGKEKLYRVSFKQVAETLVPMIPIGKAELAFIDAIGTLYQDFANTNARKFACGFAHLIIRAYAAEHGQFNLLQQPVGEATVSILFELRRQVSAIAAAMDRLLAMPEILQKEPDPTILSWFKMTPENFDFLNKWDNEFIERFQ